MYIHIYIYTHTHIYIYIHMYVCITIGLLLQTPNTTNSIFHTRRERFHNSGASLEMPCTERFSQGRGSSKCSPSGQPERP